MVFFTLLLVVIPNRNQESKKVSDPSIEECCVPERGKSLEKVKPQDFSHFRVTTEIKFVDVQANTT